MAGTSGLTRPSDEGWTIEGAEALLRTLTGVVSVRVVAKPGGEIQEIHLLTTDEVGPKQTVRNVESALMAHFDLTLDHRKISVAQTKEAPIPLPGGEGSYLQALASAPAAEERVLFLEHRVETPAPHRVRMNVTVRWNSETFVGSAEGADLPRPRMEATANAALRCVEAAMASATEDDKAPFTLVLDGIRTVDAFDRTFVLVAVMAMTGREMAQLSGSVEAGHSTDKAVILATLQAVDRWVRGRVK